MDPRPDAPPTAPDEPAELVETRSSHLIVAAVGIGLVAIMGLAWWVYFVPYTSGGVSPITCGAVLTLPEGPDQEAMLDRYDAGCDAAQADRRNTAILVGTGVVVLLAAASTWPSRRLLAARGSLAVDVVEEPADTPDEASELRRLGLLEDTGEAPEPDDDLGDEVSELRRLGLLDEVRPHPPGRGGRGSAAGDEAADTADAP